MVIQGGGPKQVTPLCAHAWNPFDGVHNASGADHRHRDRNLPGVRHGGITRSVTKQRLVMKAQNCRWPCAES